jgi:hypothetical protein
VLELLHCVCQRCNDDDVRAGVEGPPLQQQPEPSSHNNPAVSNFLSHPFDSTQASFPTLITFSLVLSTARRTVPVLKNLANRMSTFSVAKGLLWGTIGANVYIYAKWHVVLDPKAVKQGRDSHAYRMAMARHIRYMQDNYTISTRNIAEGRWWTLLTSAFSHHDLTHLGINMLVLRK